MTKRRDETEALSSASRLQGDDWASVLTRWAMMLDHMPPEVTTLSSVRHAAEQVARRLPTDR